MLIVFRYMVLGIKFLSNNLKLAWILNLKASAGNTAKTFAISFSSSNSYIVLKQVDDTPSATTSTLRSTVVKRDSSSQVTLYLTNTDPSCIFACGY